MKRIDLITSKEYWVETLETLQKQGHTDYDIATVIANKMEEAMNYIPCCETLKDEEIPTFTDWLKNNGWQKTPSYYYYKKEGTTKERNLLIKMYQKEYYL